MNIRRKVFSIINVEGEEKMFSVNETLLSNVEQREFAEKEEDKKKKKGLTKGQKAAIATAGSILAAAGLVAGGKVLGDKMKGDLKVTRDKNGDRIVRGAKGRFINQDSKEAKRALIGDRLSKPADAVIAGTKAAKDVIVNNGRKALNLGKETSKKAVEATKEAGKKAINASKEAGKKAVDATKNAAHTVGTKAKEVAEEAGIKVRRIFKKDAE